MPVISLLPFGTVDGTIIGEIGAAVEQTFRASILFGEPAAQPEFAFDAVRHQYSSELILRSMVRLQPGNVHKVLGIVDVDIFIPMLSFVFGQAQLNGRVSVVSMARLKQEFYGLQPNRRLLVERLTKESLHELGHTFGLTHCPDQSCCMSVATGIVQLDAKGEDLCRDCSLLLDQALTVLSET